MPPIKIRKRLRLAPPETTLRQHREFAGQARAGERKVCRKELRLTAQADDLIRKAMAISGLSAGDLAYEGARRLLADHELYERVSAARTGNRS